MHQPQPSNAATTVRTGPDTARIVVGVDGTPSSVAALRWAARLAGALDLGIDAVTVWEYAARQHSYAISPGGDYPRDDASHRLIEVADAAFGAVRPARLRLLVHSGHSPIKVLLEASRGAELLVLGSRGHSGVTGVLLGSVSAACAERADCPVLVVHEKDGTAFALGGLEGS